MIFFPNVFITREVSAIGRKSLGSFGLSFLGIGITAESFQMSGMVYVSMGVWKRRWKTPQSCSAQNLRVLPQIPSGPGHLFTPVCLNSPNTLLVNNSTVVRHQGLLHIGNVWWKIVYFETSEETVHVVWQSTGITDRTTFYVHLQESQICLSTGIINRITFYVNRQEA